jgi:hypothetical protein
MKLDALRGARRTVIHVRYMAEAPAKDKWAGKLAMPSCGAVLRRGGLGPICQAELPIFNWSQL